MDTQLVETVITGRYIKWYERKGYRIPTHLVQLWVNKNGQRVKNGTEKRVANGTRLMVSTLDLPPASNTKVEYICDTCGETFTVKWQDYRKKMSKSCKICAARKGFKGGCQDYWCDKLINDNPDAKCDISGETDKRFLELHHLLSPKLGGKNAEANYVVMSANYHTAFHRWVGTQKATTPEQYHEFKKMQIKSLH